MVSNEDFIQKCTEHIQKFKEQLNSQTQFCKQNRFTVKLSKNLAQLRRREQSALENRLNILESNVSSNKMLEEYNKRKNKIEEIYGNIAEGFKIRSKISWYQEGEKSSKIF